MWGCRSKSNFWSSARAETLTLSYGPSGFSTLAARLLFQMSLQPNTSPKCPSPICSPMVYVVFVARLVMTSPGVGGITDFAGGPRVGVVSSDSGGEGAGKADSDILTA